jgi:hypothetical protein
VTPVGHAELAQDPPGLAAPVQSVGPLVEAVAAPFVGAGSTSAGVRFHHDDRLSRSGRDSGSRKTCKAGADHNNCFRLVLSHADMTPRPTFL